MDQPASHPAVRLPRRWRAAGHPDAAGSGAAAPDHRYGVRRSAELRPRSGDNGDDSDINIDMGAAVESVVIDVIVVIEAGGGSNETLAYQNRHLEYDIAYAPPCDIVQTYKIRQRLLTIEHKFDII